MSIDIREQIVKNSFWNILSSLINRVGGFILIILLSRSLLPEGFGRYSLAMTISLFFITFSDFGINQTLIKYAALGIDQRKNEPTAYFRYLFKIKFFVISIASLTLFIISYPISLYIFKDQSLYPLLRILSFYVFFISLTGFFESLFFIRKNVKYIFLKEFISLTIKLTGLLTILSFVSLEFKLPSIFLFFVGISILTLFLVVCFSKKVYPNLFNKTKKIIDKKGISKFIFFLNIQAISLIVLSQATIILLGIFLEQKFIGYYNSSWVLVIGISSLLLSSLSYILLPIFTSLDEQRFQHILKKVFRLFFILVLPITFGLSILSRYFIFAIYGYDYLPASTSLSILSLLIPCIIGTELSMVSFSSRGKQKYFSIQMLISTGIFLLLNYLSILFLLKISHEAVIIGVSIANLISWLLCFGCSIFLLKKELNVSVISLWTLKPLFSCLVMSILLFFLLKIFGEMNILKGIITILIGASFYICLLLLIKGIGREELEEISKILSRFKK